MQVCLFTDADVFAGTERHVLDLACGLDRDGLPVKVACPQPSPLSQRAEKAAIEVVPIAKRGLIDWGAVQILAALLRTGEIDLIHAHNGRTALAAALAVRLAGRGAFVATQHFLEPAHTQRHGVKSLPVNLAHRWVQARTDYSIAISEAVRDRMLARREAPEARITVVPNGLSCDDSALAPPAAIRAEFGIPADAPLIVCVARLEPEKDIATLLAAMPSVLKSQPDARAVIVGDGSQRPALAQDVERLQISHAVQLAGFREDALAVIRAGDLFVLPSVAEPFGLVLLEAMALAKPVVAIHAGGPREIVVEGETGLLVPPASPDAMAAAITQLIQGPSQRRRLGDNGRRRYQALYSVERMAAATAAVYRKALGEA
jgi:glycosyltransferase involved in cell wall biosynthesis